MHKDSTDPGNLKQAVVASAGVTEAPQSVPGKVRAKSRLRDYTGWVLNPAEAAKLATVYGPFKHTFCGPVRSEGDHLLATDYPLEQFGNVRHLSFFFLERESSYKERVRQQQGGITHGQVNQDTKRMNPGWHQIISVSHSVIQPVSNSDAGQVTPHQGLQPRDAT